MSSEMGIKGEYHRYGPREWYELTEEEDFEEQLGCLNLENESAKNEVIAKPGKEERKAPAAPAKAADEVPVAMPARAPAAPAKAVGGAPVAMPAIQKTVGIVKPLLLVKNAHQDDIHGMLQVGENEFVTGSKDGSIKMWNSAGKLLRNVWTSEKIDYREWITALAPFGVRRWLSGTRSGYLDLWSNAGEHIKSLQVPVKKPVGVQCKLRNLGRISGLAQSLNSDLTSCYYVGGATQFSTYHMDTSVPLNTCITSRNDWVYCITPLTDKKIMVVTGANLDICTLASDRWMKKALITEPLSTGKGKRPFISNVTPLDGKPGVYGIAVFGGSLKILDLNTQKIVRTYQEHVGRVWQVENIRPEIFASCSDDCTIKIWDARLAASATTMSGNIGRVSTLLRLSETLLISGSCPDNLRATLERAQLNFFDIRGL